jgi:plastocyanin
MRGAACAGVAGALLLLPVAAQARTTTVHMGEPASSVKQFEQKYGSDANDFFPHGVTIHVGDKVKFSPDGFHTVDIPRRHGKPLPLITPQGPVTGVNDEAGSPFWFNGQPNLGFNPALLKGIFGKHVTYRAGKGIESGLPLANKPKPFTVKFTMAGRYTYFCNLHPGMKGVVRVVGKRHKIPSAKAVKKAIKAQVKRDLKIAKSLSKTTAPAATVDVGVTGAHNVEFYGMVPGNLTVKTGTTVKFRMFSGSTEDHTATFGTDPEKPGYLQTLANSFLSPTIDPRAAYPSDPPGTLATLTPTLHGNGFWNSGVLDTTKSTPLPASGSVTFGQAGTYNYYCLIHPFMHGVITVTP